MAATGKIIKDGSTNNASKPVYIKSDGTLADATVALPSGIICMWSGAANAIPLGWYLCNGSNGTPDLRNRFIVGAGSNYTVGNTGGVNTVTLTINQIPSHSHTIPKRNDSNVGTTSYSASSWTNNYMTTDNNWETTSTGGGLGHENRPPYYALCFIMKG